MMTIEEIKRYRDNIDQICTQRDIDLCDTALEALAEVERLKAENEHLEKFVGHIDDKELHDLFKYRQENEKLQSEVERLKVIEIKYNSETHVKYGDETLAAFGVEDKE